jgi:hypothetical protein
LKLFFVFLGAAFNLLSPIGVYAEVEPITVRLPEAKAWTGQRLRFFVELRSRGSFAGATSFILPEIPDTVIMKPGGPVVSSEEIEGETWFLQTHEFALFSQRDSAVEIPAFPVHFGTRDGFTGPVTEVEAKVPAIQVEIERPPSTEGFGFLVTTESLDISEEWNPNPAGPVQTGAVFKRTITQRAEGVTGMALAPAPTAVSDGIRVYPDQPDVSDQTDRGEFTGERVETVTYLVEQPGRHTLPAIRYAWWNPATEALESKTLPAVTFTAIALPAPTESKSPSRFLWLLLPVALAAGLVWFYRASVVASMHRLRTLLDPPHRRAARALLQACRRHDAPAAASAWSQWEHLHPGFVPRTELREQILALHRYLYGPSQTREPWHGESLATAFQRCSSETSARSRLSVLPPLNPSSGIGM